MGTASSRHDDADDPGVAALLAARAEAPVSGRGALCDSAQTQTVARAGAAEDREAGGQ